jgi:hypothetical protein
MMGKSPNRALYSVLILLLVLGRLLQSVLEETFSLEVG